LAGLEIKTYKDKVVFIFDISGTQPEEAIIAMREAQKEISKQPLRSVLILTDATDAVFNYASVNALKEFTAKNTPFIKASASLGSDDMREVLLKVLKLTPCATSGRLRIGERPWIGW
jgi:hypothetical protein